MPTVELTFSSAVATRLQNAGVTKAWLIQQAKNKVIAHETAEATEQAKQAVIDAQANMQALIDTAHETAEAEVTLT